MAKGNRQRTNKDRKVEVKKNLAEAKSKAIKKSNADYPVKTLNQMHNDMFKETFGLSNQVAKLINQQQMKLKQLAQGDKFIKRLRDGKVKLPLLVQQGAKVFAPMDDKKAIIADIKSESKIIKESMQITEGQLAHYYDEYVASLTRAYYAMESLLGEFKKINDVSTNMKLFGKTAEKESEQFMQKFDLENPKEVEKAKVAIKKVVKANEHTAGKSGKKTR